MIMIKRNTILNHINHTKQRFAMLAAVVLCSTAVSACEKPQPEPEPEPEPVVTPTIELSAPEDNATIVLSPEGSVSFNWIKVDGINNYKLALSLDKDMGNPYTVAALTAPLTFTGKEFDKAVGELGVESESTADIYWSIIPFSARTEAETQVRKMTVTRLQEAKPVIGENADTIIVKVGVLYEDMIVTSEGKRLHECCRWADPHKQVKDMARFMTEASHGVVQYEIAVEIESEKPFGYYYEDTVDGSGAAHKAGEVVTADICYHNFYKSGKYPGLYEGVKYNYTEMVKYHGFDKMMNNHEIDEIWVYNHPGAGMFETCMAGPGAFWINGDVFDVPGLERKLSVVFCNYERTVDLAMHSYAHRLENVMKQVYGRWSYTVASEKNLNNWERFSAYNLQYDKYDKGMSHIGNCHFPCNATADYSYESRTYIKSYCDAWDSYPYLKLENPRNINCSEWGSTQLGYMKWFFGHLPHFKGLNTDPNDYHLNNWWYYLVDFDGAKAYERKLIMEL